MFVKVKICESPLSAPLYVLIISTALFPVITNSASSYNVAFKVTVFVIVVPGVPDRFPLNPVTVNVSAATFVTELIVVVPVYFTVIVLLSPLNVAVQLVRELIDTSVIFSLVILIVSEGIVLLTSMSRSIAEVLKFIDVVTVGIVKV